jgi:hypothetical protein
MLKFSKLTEYRLLEFQEDLKTIFMVKNNYIKIRMMKKLKKLNNLNVYLKNIKWN